MKYIELIGWFMFFPWCCIKCEESAYSARVNKANSSSSLRTRSISDPLYSNWSQWTSCSASCGSGVISRTRYCLKSIKNEKGITVPLCQGEITEHKICSLKMCPENSTRVRDSQCSKHNNQVTAGRLIKEWISSKGGPNPCELRCEATHETLVYSFGKVADGTSCPHGVCLNGRCLSVGCDGRLGSSTNVDMCGVCGGRNSSCVHYKDIYQGQLPPGGDDRGAYHEVVVIPFAARNIRIRQKPGKNILALQDKDRGIIFSSEQSLSKPNGGFDIAGTSVMFRKVSDNVEELIAEGSLTQELYVLVLLRAYNPGIFFEYWLPKQSQTPGRNAPSSIWHPNIPVSRTTVAPTSFIVPPFKRQTPSAKPRVRYHPSKPPFAYGYGEKPLKTSDLPGFRRLQTTPSSFSEEGKHSLPQPDTSLKFRKYVPVYKAAQNLDYYRTFRNFSVQKVAKIASDTRKELRPVQGDSGIVNGQSGKYKSRIFEDAYKEKKKDLEVLKNRQKRLNAGIVLQKREENPKSYVSNGRLKYSFEDKNDQNIDSNSQKNPPITINVLPESVKQKLHSSNKGHCQPCQRTRDQAKHFCDSDFVIRATIISYEFVGGETRYEVDVRQSFKNNLSLLPKEYLWSPDTCRCPKLRIGKEYIIMGLSDNRYKKRESRLLVDQSSFVRTFNLKYARRLQKLRKDQDKKCKNTS